MPDLENTYIPGTCNIGKKEIERRNNFAIVGTVVSVLFIVATYLLHLNNGWRLLLFLPLSIAVISGLQSYFKFCVAFGLKGLFNFGDVVGKVKSAKNEEYLKKDRAQAWKIIIIALVLSMALTAIYFVI